MKKMFFKKIMVLNILIILSLITFNHAYANDISDSITENKELSFYRLNQPLPDQLDQFQNNSDVDYQIYRDQYIAQTFKPTLEILTRIKILMRKTMDVTLPDLFVQIENMDKENIGFSSLNSSELTEEFIWYEFDFETDINLNVGETYTIILYSYCHEITQCYEVSCSIYDDYVQGDFFISSNGIFWDPENNVDLCFETYGFNEELIPDLETSGSLKWTEKVKPGSTILGEFSVINVGDPGSELKWYIEENWDWSEISIIPLNGDNLKPEDEEVIVQVSIVVPDESTSSFNGSLKVINEENPDDFNHIEISFITPKNKVNFNGISFKFFFKNIFNFF